MPVSNPPESLDDLPHPNLGGSRTLSGRRPDQFREGNGDPPNQGDPGNPLAPDDLPTLEIPSLPNPNHPQSPAPAISVSPHADASQFESLTSQTTLLTQQLADLRTDIGAIREAQIALAAGFAEQSAQQSSFAGELTTLTARLNNLRTR